MAILLGAFLIHGLVPGPDMLTKNLSITYAMVWSVALANILGAGLCYAFSPQFAKLATLRFTLILPAVLGIVYIGAFEATRSWGDLFALLGFGVVGWLMKQFKWPRPPLILGVVLGDSIERYLFISIERYGVSWFARPVVAILFALAILGLVRPLLTDIRHHGGLKRMLTNFQAPRFHPAQLFTIFFMVVVGAMLANATEWDFSAKVVPLVVGTIAFVAAALSLFNDLCRKPETSELGIGEQAQQEVGSRIHMDLTSDTGHLGVRTIAGRAAWFFGYLVGFMAVMAVIGLIPTVVIFVIFFMRFEGPERWSLVIPYTVVLVLGIYIAFDVFMAVPWPPTLLGTLFPALKVIPSM
jgi:putative tricarboxylic transport membrane protein